MAGEFKKTKTDILDGDAIKEKIAEDANYIKLAESTDPAITRLPIGSDPGIIWLPTGGLYNSANEIKKAVKIGKARRFFQHTEFMIMVVLLKSGTCTLSSLTKLSGLNKTTILSKLGKMVADGVVISEMRIIQSKAIRFLSLHPENFKKLLQEIKDIIAAIEGA